MIRLRPLIIAILTLCLAWMGTAQTSAIPVILPVRGQLALPQGGFLLDNIDTYTGEMQVLLDKRAAMENLQFPFWNAQGDHLVLDVARNHSTILNLITGTDQVVEMFPGYTSNHIFYPAGWSNDGTNILYFSVIVRSLFSRTTALHLMDTGTGVLTTIGTKYEMGQPLPSSFPLPTGIDQAIFGRFSNVLRNPTYDQWVLLQLDVFNAELASDVADAPPEAQIQINVLWNHVTGQLVSLDDLFLETVYPQADWSTNGELLFVTLLGKQYGVIRFENPTGNASVSVIDTVTTARTVQYWLDVGDLMIAVQDDETSDDNVYYIGQIIDGTWYETEFFRLPESASVGFYRGDWYLTASEDEQHALSCLFDQALPTRLTIGTRARVNFTTGSPLRLRTEPSVDSAEILQMPEGTEFNIISGPACENADSYYRFWQLQLDDGTLGWAVESSNTDYFVEPVA